MNKLRPFSKDPQNWAIGSLIGLSIIGIFMIVSYFTRNDWIKDNRDYCEKDRMIQLQGVVDTCYLDYNNKGNFTALLKTKNGVVKQTSWYIQYPQAYIRPGDSIIKETGTFRYTIYRTNSKPVTIDEKFDCDHWEKFRE
jgi:hypothetical protein